jgi:hypothetical protein
MWYMPYAYICRHTYAFAGKKLPREIVKELQVEDI